MTTKRKTGRLIRLLRERMAWDQKDLAKKLKVSRPSISKWERGIAVPPIDILWKLGILCPPMRYEFRDAAGLSRDEMAAYVAFLHEEFLVSPGPGDVVRVPPLRDAQQGMPEKGPDLLLSPGLVTSVLSTRYLVIDESSMGQGLEIGDILVLDVSENDAENLTPFWDRRVLFDLDWEMYRGPSSDSNYGPNQKIAGRLALGEGPPRTPSMRSWMAFIQPWSDEPIKAEPLWAGELEYPSALQTGKDPTQMELRQKALRELRLYKYWKVLGRIVGWFRPPQKATGE